MVLLALVGYQVLIGLFLGFFEAIRLGLAATEFAKGGPGGDPEKPLLLMSTEGLSVAMLAAGGAVTFFILYDVVLRLRQPLATLGV